jgi:hypothetical protein
VIKQVEALLPKPKKDLRARTASTKVTDTEFAELGSYAYERGQSVSEWIRQTLLNEVRTQSNESMNRHIFTELVGVQLLLINTLGPLIRGETMTAEHLAAVFKQVQTTKGRKALELLAKRANDLRSGEPSPPQ